MTRILTIIFMVLVSISGASAQETARVEVKYLDSKNFPFKRPVLIFTPNEYDESTQSEYDVIYVFDSQWRSRFDLVHSLMHYGCQPENEDTRPFIVVGIPSPYLPDYNYERNMDFYSMPVNKDHGMESLYFWSVDCNYISSYGISFLAEKIEELETICNSHSHHRTVHVAFTILFFQNFSHLGLSFADVVCLYSV